MGSKRNSWKKLAMAIAVPGVAVGTLAGFAAAPAMASTTRPGPAIKTIQGYGNGPSGNLHVWASGAFFDHGSLNVNSPGPFDQVHLSHGSLFVQHSQGWTQTHVNPWSCVTTSTNHSQYQIVGGSGQYQHVWGYGDATITFTGQLPRKPNQQCNTKADPLPWTVQTTFEARGPVSLH